MGGPPTVRPGDDYSDTDSEKDLGESDPLVLSNLEKVGEAAIRGELTGESSTDVSASRGTATARKDGSKTKAEKRETVAWRDLPRKGQLTVLTLARLSEPLVQTSLQVRSPWRL
jgi:hypothetical protein